MAFGFARLKVDDGITFLKETPSVVFDKELDRIAVGIKAEFLGDETKRNICLVTVGRRAGQYCPFTFGWRMGNDNLRFAHVAQCSKALTIDKHVHEVRAHLDVSRVNVELEETMIVA